MVKITAQKRTKLIANLVNTSKWMLKKGKKSMALLCFTPSCIIHLGLTTARKLTFNVFNSSIVDTRSGINTYNEDSSLPIQPIVQQIHESGDQFVHRLVQDENAKTILLNVPLELNAATAGK